MGGDDSANNIITLSVKEHALAHKKLFEKYGKRQDLLAYKSLSKQINKEDIWLERSSIGGSNNKGILKTKVHKKKIARSLKGIPFTQERKTNISLSMMNNKNSSNHKSSEYKHKQSLAMKKAWQKKYYD